MTILPIQCNQCGANLEVGLKARYATCGFCHAKLRIHHTINAHFSEMTETLAIKTLPVSGILSTPEKSAALDVLDQDWARTRDTLMHTNNNGTKSIPTFAGAITSAILSLIVGTLIIYQAAQRSSTGIFLYIGPLVILGGVGTALWNANKASKFLVAQKRYQGERQMALQNIQNKKKRRS